MNIRIGEKYNRLLIKEIYFIYREKKSGGKQKIWMAKCICDCGNEHDTQCQAIIGGRCQSCGCLNQELRKARTGKNNGRYSHGKIDHPLYECWKSMKTRCNNPNYLGYLKDTKIYDEWYDFQKFYEWAINIWFDGSCLTRKNDSGDFNPENCYFDTKGNCCKNNFDVEKFRETCLKKYGVEHPAKLDFVRKKIEKTCMERYGVKSPLESNEIKEKIKQTNLERYGVENALQAKNVIEQNKLLYFNKTGYLTPLHNPEVQAKCRKTSMERYGNPYGNNKTSKQQEKIVEYIKSLGVDVVPNEFSLNGKQLDIFIPEFNIGIEYCGLYWHTEFRGCDRMYHYNKYITAKEQGIKLLTIFSDEWQWRKNAVEDIIASYINKNKEIDEYNCQLIDYNTGNEFIKINDIKYANKYSKYHIGLSCDNELFGVMAIRNLPKKNGCVIDNVCFKNGYLVKDGYQKMLEKAIAIAESNSITAISDNKWGDGDVFKNLGFKLTDMINPDYWYVNLQQSGYRINKRTISKEELKIENKYSKIWDCGKKRWIISC